MQTAFAELRDLHSLGLFKSTSFAPGSIQGMEQWRKFRSLSVNVLQVSDERKAWEKCSPSSPINPKDKNVPLKLRKLRYYFDNDLSKIRSVEKRKARKAFLPLAERMEELVKVLTTEGKIKEALGVRKMKEALLAGTLVIPKEKEAPSEEPSGTTNPESDSSSIPGFALGQPGAVKGFGVYSHGKEIDMALLGTMSDILDVNADNGRYWNILSRSHGAMFNNGRRRVKAVQFSKGEVNSGGILKLEDGNVFHYSKKVIPPERYGGGIVVEIAVAKSKMLVLKQDGTVQIINDPVPWISEINKDLADIKNAIAIDASHFHFGVLTREGRVYAWRAGRVETGVRALDLSGIGEGIIEIASSRSGFYALDKNGEVWFANDIGSGNVRVTKPRGGQLKDIRHIWAGGDCGVALDKKGKLYAWSKDHAGVGFVKQIEALRGFSALAIMDTKRSDGAATHAIWIEPRDSLPGDSTENQSATNALVENLDSEEGRAWLETVMLTRPTNLNYYYKQGKVVLVDQNGEIVRSVAAQIDKNQIVFGKVNSVLTFINRERATIHSGENIHSNLLKIIPRTKN